jgi:hypothetical protein
MNILETALGFSLSVAKPRWGFWMLLGLAMAYPSALFDPAIDTNAPIWSRNINVSWIQLGCSLGLILFLLRKFDQTTLPSFFLPLASFILLYILVGIVRNTGIKNVIMEGSPLLAYVTLATVVQTIKSESDIKRLLSAIIIFCTLASAGAVLEHILGVSTISRSYTGVRRASFDYASDGKAQIGSFVFITLFVFANLYFDLRQYIPFSNKKLILFFIINVYGTVLTMNRTMFFCYSLLALFAIFVVLRRKSVAPRAFLFAAGAYGFLLVLNASFPINPLLLGKLAQVEFAIDEHRQYEPKLLDTVWESPQQFFLGAGAGQLWYKSWTDSYEVGNHNFYIQIVWKSGFLGTLLLLIMTNSFILGVRKRAMLVQKYTFTGLANWTYSLLFLFLFMSITQNRFFSAQHIPLIGVLMGLPVALEQMVEEYHYTLHSKTL